MIDTGFDWTLAPLVWLVLMGGMLLSMQAVMRVRARHLRAAQSDSTGLAAVHGAVFALMGLLMAFTFLGPPAASTIAATLLSRKPTTSARRTSGSRFSLKQREALYRTSFGNTWTPGSRPTTQEPTSCESVNCCGKPLNSKVRFGEWRWRRSTMPRVHLWRHRFFPR